MRKGQGNQISGCVPTWGKSSQPALTYAEHLQVSHGQGLLSRKKRGECNGVLHTSQASVTTGRIAGFVSARTWKRPPFFLTGGLVTGQFCPG